MELIHLLINSLKSDMCLLCFKESANTEYIHSRIEVRSQFFTETLSLADIINYLFPSFELTLKKACQDCTDLIIRMYIAIHRNNIIKKIINIIIDIFNREITKNNSSSLDIFGKHNININLSKIIEDNKKTSVSFRKYDICDLMTNDNDLYDEKISDKSIEENFDLEKQCPTCYKLFINEKQFKTHIKSHTRKRKRIYHSCTYCNYKSLCKESLRGHINKNHLKTRPFVCKICYKNFYHKKNLVEHETSHRQVRNEICEVCGDSFIHKKNLLEHLKLHSGEKPFDCDICGKRFVTSGRRLEHIKRCHSEKNESCLLCDKKFSLNKELSRHMKTVHS